jgi:hypothetical protein
MIMTPLSINADEEPVCDILCQAGINVSDIPKPKVSKEVYESNEASTLFIKDTSSTKQQLRSLELFFEEMVGETLPISFDIGNAYGTERSFSVGNLEAVFEDGSESLKVFSIGELSCSGDGVNDASAFYKLYQDLIIEEEYITTNRDSTCNIDNLSINIEGILSLSGESLEDEFGREVAAFIYDFIKNIDIRMEGSNTFDDYKDELVSSATFTIDFNGRAKVSYDFKQGQNPYIYVDLLEIMREIFIVEDRYGVKDTIKDNPLEFWKEFIEATIADPNWMEEEFDGIDLYCCQTLYKLGIGMAWSSSFYRDISILSGGAIDAGMLFAKAYTANKMNKYEIQMLLQNFGFDRDLQGLYLDVVYSYYDLVFDELKLFVDDPRGLQIGVEFKDGLNASIMEKIEENPMLIFTILNNMELNLSANPRI